METATIELVPLTDGAVAGHVTIMSYLLTQIC